MSADSGYQFVDTNVLVYAHDTSAGLKHEQAKTLMQTLWQTQTGCLSIQVLQEFYVTVTQKVKRPLSPQTTAQIIQELQVWHMHTPRPEDVLSAIQLQTRYQISFWDAMIIQSAVQLKCSTLWSEDFNAGQIFLGVSVENPFVG
ncbi:MAG: PIN domain-containing protein [Chloroflexota bacterium]